MTPKHATPSHETRAVVRQGGLALIPIAEPLRHDRALNEDGSPVEGLWVQAEGGAHAIAGRVYTTPPLERPRLRAPNTRGFASTDECALFLERPTALAHPAHDPEVVPAGWWRAELRG